MIHWQMDSMAHKLKRYFYFSGGIIGVVLNPLHWKILPWWRDETNHEWGSNQITWSAGFLFLNIRIWIDRGKW